MRCGCCGEKLDKWDKRANSLWCAKCRIEWYNINGKLLTADQYRRRELEREIKKQEEK